MKKLLLAVALLAITQSKAALHFLTKAVAPVTRLGLQTLRYTPTTTIIMQKRFAACHDRLKIKPTATKEEIEKAFRAQAKKAHPDAGGSNQAFQKIQDARNECLEKLKNNGEIFNKETEKEKTTDRGNFFHEILTDIFGTDTLYLALIKINVTTIIDHYNRKSASLPKRFYWINKLINSNTPLPETLYRKIHWYTSRNAEYYAVKDEGKMVKTFMAWCKYYNIKSP
jgi:hypothetical protein